MVVVVGGGVTTRTDTHTDRQTYTDRTPSGNTTSMPHMYVNVLWAIFFVLCRQFRMFRPPVYL